MTSREEAARAMAFFELSDDIGMLHQLAGEVAPKAKKLIAQYLARGTEDSIPPPADLRASKNPAGKDEAVRAVRQVTDFALLQAMARSIGRRIEAIEIVASADFPEGARVIVPAKVTYPPSGPSVAGTVEVTGTALRVLLDSGETWEGPPSQARLEAAP